MSDAIHHLHKRKRIHEQHEEYPHPQTLKRFLDKIIYVIGVVGPAFGFTQVYKIWYYQEASGISIALFGSHIFFNAIWILYGIYHKEKPIILMYSLWLIINTFITIGAIMYS